MKKIIIFLFVIVIATSGVAQPYFQATMTNSGNTLTFSIKPTGGNINNIRFSAIEFFVRYPTPAPPFTFSTPVVDPAFAGMNFTVKGPNLYGSEAGFTNYVFEWIGGATFIPAAPTTYNDGTPYPLFSVNLVGPNNITDIEFVHNTNQNPTYINISDNNGNSLSCLNNSGVTIGDAFYGPGFNIITAPTGGNDHLLPLSAVPIPVKFTKFTAVKKGADGLLNWWVENETALTDSYIIERSLNGTNFTPITTLPATVNSGSNAYQYIDPNLKALHSDIIYYKIKQIDKDGKFAYTEIRSIRLNDKSFTATVFPNPVKTTGSLNLDLSADSKVNILLTDASGKEVQKATIDGKKGLNIHQLNMANLAAGTYQLKVTAGSDSKVIPVVKSK